MKRRTFIQSIGAAVAAFFVPAPPVIPAPVIPAVSGFVPIEDYVSPPVRCGFAVRPLTEAEIGHYENVRFIKAHTEPPLVPDYGTHCGACGSYTWSEPPAARCLMCDRAFKGDECYRGLDDPKGHARFIEAHYASIQRAKVYR